MDIIDLERQFETLTREAFQTITEAETKIQEKIEKVFQTLTGSFEIKIAVLDKLEAEIEKDSADFQAALNKITNDIHTLENKKPRAFLDLKAKEAELRAKAEEELKPFFSEQKKKKTELTNQISAVKRELANFHKENNALLINEEKNFKARELDLEQRLNLDLERIYGEIVEEYSEFEKKLLETNDEKEIADLKYKIKEVRISGNMELKKIKDHYAFLLFENRLEFRKFAEKVILENSLKSEETKVRVQALESEKTKLEQEEENEIQKAEFEIQKLLLESERDNDVYKNQGLLERQLQIVDFESKAKQITSEKETKEKTLGVNYRKEAATFDLSQFEVYQPLSEVFFENFHRVSGSLLNALQASVKLYKETLLAMLLEFNEVSKSIHERFKNLLLLARKDELPKGGPNPKDILITLTKMTELSYRKRKQMYEKTTEIFGKEINEILIHIRNINIVLSNHQAQLKEHEEIFQKNLEEVIKKGYMDLEENLKTTKVSEFGKKRALRKTKSLLRKEAGQNNSEIYREYNRKLRKLKEKMARYQDLQKEMESRITVESREFLKKSKKRVQELKKGFSDLLVQHEKILYDEYQNELAYNSMEERERNKEL